VALPRERGAGADRPSTTSPTCTTTAGGYPGGLPREHHRRERRRATPPPGRTGAANQAALPRQHHRRERPPTTRPTRTAGCYPGGLRAVAKCTRLAATGRGTANPASIGARSGRFTYTPREERSPPATGLYIRAQTPGKRDKRRSPPAPAAIRGGVPREHHRRGSPPHRPAPSPHRPARHRPAPHRPAPHRPARHRPAPPPPGAHRPAPVDHPADLHDHGRLLSGRPQPESITEGSGRRPPRRPARPASPAATPRVRSQNVHASRPPDARARILQQSAPNRDVSRTDLSEIEAGRREACTNLAPRPRASGTAALPSSAGGHQDRPGNPPPLTNPASQYSPNQCRRREGLRWRCQASSLAG
jgi:hypothetical protein